MGVADSPEGGGKPGEHGIRRDTVEAAAADTGTECWSLRLCVGTVVGIPGNRSAEAMVDLPACKSRHGDCCIVPYHSQLRARL